MNFLAAVAAGGDVAEAVDGGGADVDVADGGGWVAVVVVQYRLNKKTKQKRMERRRLNCVVG